MTPLQHVVCITAGLTLGFAIPACGAAFESASDVSANDPLYEQVVAECGKDALVLRVEDLSDDEALCCVTHSGLVPKLHCMTKSGGKVVDPNGISTVRAVSRMAKQESAAQ